MSFCARGVLGYLLSLPDGQSIDIRTLTERTPEGRQRVASALNELQRFGYLTREVRRSPDGRIFTQVDVFETPGAASSQATPDVYMPGSGVADAGPDGDHPVKERVEEPSHPARPAESAIPGREGGIVDQEAEAGAELLARVARAEPRLFVGRCEALRLGVLVTEWRRRGASDLHVVGALTVGLPRGGVHHPARFIETRLRAKMPAERRVAPARPECDACQAPVPIGGSCHSCRESKPTNVRPSTDFAQARARGVALARAALRGFAIDDLMPVPA